MTLKISVSDQAEAKLKAKADAIGQDISTYVSGVLERAAQRPLSLEEISGPVAVQFDRSGMTEDELSELLEQVKQDHRRNRNQTQ